MTPDDDRELHRLADMLQTIDRKLDASSPLREGLVKAGIALSQCFIHGSRPKIEEEYRFLEGLRKEGG
jgi:hypothetical protein